MGENDIKGHESKDRLGKTVRGHGDSDRRSPRSEDQLVREARDESVTLINKAILEMRNTKSDSCLLQAVIFPSVELEKK